MLALLDTTSTDKQQPQKPPDSTQKPGEEENIQNSNKDQNAQCTPQKQATASKKHSKRIIRMQGT